MGGATSLTFYSEPGSYIGGGRTYSFSNDTGTFTPLLFDLNSDGQIDTVRFCYQDLPSQTGDWWQLEFSTRQLGTGLTPGIYLDAERAAFATAGHPGLDVAGNGAGSNQLYGRFTVIVANLDYTGPSPVLQSFSATFEQHSETPTAPALFGTINYNHASAGPVFWDSVIENQGNGTDTVMSAIPFALPDNVENLTLTGNENIGGTGNTLDNAIVGNSGNNLLSGGSGNDSLHGGGGDDTLNGGAGVNVLQGGSGNDSYVVGDALTDFVLENPYEGTDKVGVASSYTLPANVEALELDGAGNIDGNGNELANAIRGTAGDNVLTGQDGNDGLTGGAGNDLLDGGSGIDTLHGGAGDDAYVINDVNFIGGPTSLHMQSQPGDYIGAGLSYSFDTGTGTFQPFMQDRNLDGEIDYVRVWYRDLSWPSGNNFMLEFATTKLGTNLEPGTYIGAARAAFAPVDVPGMDISGNGKVQYAVRQLHRIGGRYRLQRSLSRSCQPGG